MSDRTLLTVEQRTPEGVSQVVTGMWVGLSTASSFLPLLAMVLNMEEMLVKKYGEALPSRQWTCQIIPSPGDGFPLSRAPWEGLSP